MGIQSCLHFIQSHSLQLSLVLELMKCSTNCNILLKVFLEDDLVGFSLSTVGAISKGYMGSAEPITVA